MTGPAGGRPSWIGGAPGPLNSLRDVEGLRVGHHTMTGAGELTGTTVILGPAEGMVGGVDVRGGGPGTRETDLLDPTASVERITAITLTGGSAFGLAAPCGVADALADRGLGLPIGDTDGVVPLVPAAVLFDLGRGGRFRATPGEQAGRAALQAAFDGVGPIQGGIGAGTGALIAGLKGGVGTASMVLADGTTVAALVVINAVGSPVDQRTGELIAARYLMDGDLPAGVRLTRPSDDDLAVLLPMARPRHPEPEIPAGAVVQNTTIGVIATDATLTKAQCTKLAGISHDGLARAIDPLHTLFDGDTLFGLATCTRPAPDLLRYHELLCVAADVVSRAVVRAVLAAESVQTPGGHWQSYTDVAPSALTRTPS